MQRIVLGLALAAITFFAPHWCAAGEQEEKDTAQQIARILRDSGKVQRYSIGVKTKNGTVWLAGRVTSEAQMQAAIDVVSQIKGVQQIVNSLEVAPSGTAAGTAATPKAQRVQRAAVPIEAAEPLSVGDAKPVSQAVAQVPMAGAAATNPAVAPKAKAKVKRTKAGNASVYRGVPTGYSQLGAEAEDIGPPRQMGANGRPMPAYVPGTSGGVAPAAYDQPNMPNYSWPSYAAYPNYAAVTYPRQYSATAWPFIGPFYPYPQVPMGWRKVSLEWDDGWWFLDFDDRGAF